MTEQKIKLIIADDSNILIECFRQWIKNIPSINLIGVVHKTDEVLSFLNIEKDAIVLSSYQWILKQGKSNISRIINNNGGTSVALSLNSNNYNSIHSLISIGIKGFYGDMTTREELLKGLCDIKNYNYYMASEILTEFVEIRKMENGDNNPDKSNLTKREREILEMVLAGKNSRDIAKRLNISKRTVDGHRANINNKFGVRNTAQLYKKAAVYLTVL
ncbi:MAG: response regulator transcription factor [Bacteroidales bacterium]|nr:response regulator transcription factor [Bacteroidales bacterium]